MSLKGEEGIQKKVMLCVPCGLLSITHDTKRPVVFITLVPSLIIDAFRTFTSASLTASPASLWFS